MTASYKCSSQTIPTDTTVLKYLYKEAANAFYLRKDTAILVKELSIKDSIIINKDSLISNTNKALNTCELENRLLGESLEVQDAYQKKLKKELKKTTLFLKISIIIGSISTAYFIFN